MNDFCLTNDEADLREELLAFVFGLGWNVVENDRHQQVSMVDDPSYMMSCMQSYKILEGLNDPIP